MTGAAVLLLALALDAALGEPRWLWSRLPHPAVLMGRAVGALDARLNAQPAARAIGVLAVAVLVTLAALIGFVLAQLGPVVELLCAAILLAHRSLVDHVKAVAQGLRQSTGEGRRAVAMIVGRDVSAASDAQVARAGIESLSENYSDGVIAPAFWFLVAGLPGILIYKVVNTADSMIGYLTPRHAAFGWGAARLDDLLNWVPARVTGGLIAIVGGVAGHWTAIRSDARQHRSPNAGWPEAAMARALNIALAGPRSYHGRTEDLAWGNGDAERDIGPTHIDAAVAIVWKAWALTLVLLIVIGVMTWIF